MTAFRQTAVCAGRLTSFVSHRGVFGDSYFAVISVADVNAIVFGIVGNKEIRRIAVLHKTCG